MVSLPKSKPDYFTPKRESAQAFLTIDADFRQLPGLMRISGNCRQLPERQSLHEKRRCH
ncbi:hypothetical protein SeGA_2642 [Salmonella enterica subsp. enterica serovar Gaminara str. A4-567]|nr:hypothetical protein SeGA_2642 [Salmonella enterica subsp. enterica serovar Gaminara str. A4-567]